MPVGHIIRDVRDTLVVICITIFTNDMCVIFKSVRGQIEKILFFLMQGTG